MEDNIDQKDFAHICQIYKNANIPAKPNMDFTGLANAEFEAQVESVMHQADCNREKAIDFLRRTGITNEKSNKGVR